MYMFHVKQQKQTHIQITSTTPKSRLEWTWTI